MNKLIAEIGKVLHGEQFVSPLANDLNVNRKTIQRYIAEESAVNMNLYPEILDLLQKHQEKTIHLISKIESFCRTQKFATEKNSSFNFMIERQYLKNLVENNKKVILNDDFYTIEKYSPYNHFGKNKKRILSQQIKFDGVNGKYIQFTFLNTLEDGTIEDCSGFQIHVCNINPPEPSKITINRSDAKAIYNAVFSGLPCYVDRNLDRPVMVLDGVVIECKSGEKLSKEDFWNIWYYSPHSASEAMWQKAEALGMYSQDRTILEVE